MSSPEISMTWGVGPQGHGWVAQHDEYRGVIRVEPHYVEFHWYIPFGEGEARWYVTVIGPIVRQSDELLSKVRGRITYWSNEDDRTEKMLSSAPYWVQELVDQALTIIGDDVRQISSSARIEGDADA